MTLAVEVYDGTNPGGSSAIRTFTEDTGRSARVVHNDDGSWSVTVPRASTDAGYVLTNRWIKFRLNGSVVASGRIQPWEQDTIAQGEESAEDLTINGLGLLNTLRDPIIYPHVMTGRLARDTRWFNFASPDYPREGTWGTAVALFQQGDPSTSLYGVTIPEDWPDRSAWWIWGVPWDFGASPPAPLGDCYFRTTVTLASEGDYAFFITADDGYELWVDGVQLAAQTEAFIFRQTFRIDQFLDAGDHVIAIKGTNMLRPATPDSNVAAVLFAMYSTTAGGDLNVLQVHSDDTWACTAYPATPPGFYPGEILEILLQEAYDRGGIQVWSWTFTGAEDSNGDPWTVEIEKSFRFSQKVRDVLADLAETYIDFHADPDTIELDVVIKGGLGAAGVTLSDGTHLESLHHSNDPTRVTDMLMRDAEDKLTEVSSGLADDPPNGDNPRIEEFLEAGGSPSSEAATEQAAGVFDNAGAARVIVSAGVAPVAGAMPFANFGVGQTITMPDRNGSGATTTVTAIVLTDVPTSDDGELEGSVVYAVEGYQDAA